MVASILRTIPDELNPWKDINRDGKYHVYDPLVLDLDGDGIETIGTQGYAGALFDHDKDGIRTSTGWAAADDGLLVIDRNSDGLINNGGELFGDSTVLKDGSNAAHGYAALAESDTNVRRQSRCPRCGFRQTQGMARFESGRRISGRRTVYPCRTQYPIS
ncbi:hypothetical protein [Neisseria weixii]|uniref:hypothetical protein n=1 Tax=Neisseria weixii TaxID=1853276 RepID=UPI001E3C262F|nr:hypothetical protein [Neisseria weixii]